MKPLFKSAFLNRRCIVPANGFYEWKKEGRKRIKYKIKFKDNRLFSIAGIYGKSIDKSGIEYIGFTIVTTQANDLITEIHNRMPVILDNSDEKIWTMKIINNIESMKEILKPYNYNKSGLEMIPLI